jgi:hypothetical protein
MAQNTPIGLGEWAPDIALLDSSFSAIAENVYPGANSYLPFPGLTAVETSTLSGTIVGLVFARTTTGSFAIFAASRTKLYKYSAGAWVDVTRLAGGDYNVAAGHSWSFAQFGTFLYATHVGDVLQRIAVDAGANFAAVAGSPPQASHVSVIGDFLVLAGLSTDGSAIQWSAVGDPTGWTVGTNLSDTQSFPEGGLVVGMAGGEVGYVMQDRTVRAMNFLQGDISTIFSFSRIEDKKGCIAGSGFVTVNQTVYFLAEDGFYSISLSQGLSPIGHNKVNAWFLANSDPARRGQIRAFAVPNKPVVMWSFHSSSSSTSHDRLLIYDWSLRRWTYALVSAQIWATLASPGVTMDEDLDALDALLDSIAPSLDSSAYTGGRPVIGAIDPNGYLSFLEGNNLAATFDTAEKHLVPSRRSFVNQVYPLLDASSVTITPGTRERLQDSVMWGQPSSLEGTGSCSMLSSGRLHRFRIQTAEGASWTHAQGVIADAQPDGEA